MECILVSTNINQWWAADCVSWDHEQPWLQDYVPKSLEMKFSYKYQWSSFLDHQDGWYITDKQRRTALHHAIGGQILSRRNLSLHLQSTPICQPRISENQERLMEEEYEIVCTPISWKGWYKEMLNARERSCSMDLSHTWFPCNFLFFACLVFNSNSFPSCIITWNSLVLSYEKKIYINISKRNKNLPI
jgi:hypothetical protein